MYNGKKVTAIIGAAGSGSRMGGPLPKQYMKMGGRTILEHALIPFETSNYVDNILVIAGQDFVTLCEGICSGFFKVKKVLIGGATRQDSVYQGIKTLEDGQLVLIHDAVRPYVSEILIHDVLKDADEAGAAVPAVPSKDTVRQKIHKGSQSSITLDRDLLYQVQTPQAFRTERVKEAYWKAKEDGYLGTDDASLVERLGYPVILSEGSYDNIKITTREDLPMEMRIGTGFDVHRLVEGRPLVLGGVIIPYEKGLLGHSDADVMIHAFMDAMLGAAGLGDIGVHFPDSDPAYKGISSMKLLEQVNLRLNQAGYMLSNGDITIIAQKPKLAEYLPTMRKNIAEVLEIAESQINVKATTTEKLGFTGRGEGIAAEAVCLLKYK